MSALILKDIDEQTDGLKPDEVENIEIQDIQMPAIAVDVKKKLESFPILEHIYILNTLPFMDPKLSLLDNVFYTPILRWVGQRNCICECEIG